MPSENRISGISLKASTFKAVADLAAKENRSLPGQARQLVEEALRTRAQLAVMAEASAEKRNPGRA